VFGRGGPRYENDPGLKGSVVTNERGNGEFPVFGGRGGGKRKKVLRPVFEAWGFGGGLGNLEFGERGRGKGGAERKNTKRWIVRGEVNGKTAWGGETKLFLSKGLLS